MKIAVVGPQNTGKSTFIKDFLVEFDGMFSGADSTYRDIIETENLQVNQSTTEFSQRKIMDFMKESVSREKDKSNIIFDRCLIDNYIYTKLAFDDGKIGHDFVIETYTNMIKDIHNYQYIFFIPTQIGISLVDDGTRDVDVKFIDKVNKEFMIILFYLAKEFNINVKIISGSRENRISDAKKALSL